MRRMRTAFEERRGPIQSENEGTDTNTLDLGGGNDFLLMHGPPANPQYEICSGPVTKDTTREDERDMFQEEEGPRRSKNGGAEHDTSMYAVGLK